MRTECDAFYPSEIEPWSYWLTGEQGKAPEFNYDPLEHAIKLSKQRGMEFHAWFNPFRAKADTSGYVNDSTHISNRKPEWIIQSAKYKFLNPGIPNVREYVKKVVLDVVSRYDIDGVHFDDYFYPYGGVRDEDFDTYKNYSRNFSNINEWRRDNVNIFIRDIYNSIKQIKPYVKFGISPFGIWKNGVPEGIKGFSAYNNIYCDAVYWLNEEIVDYIAPQLYWKIGGEQDYIKLSNWWAEQTKNRDVYIGHALYKMEDERELWRSGDITEQIKLNQQSRHVKGSIFFRAKDIQNNLNGIADSLQQKYYKIPALIPEMKWIDSTPPPLFPFNLVALPSSQGIYLRWENPKFTFSKDKIKRNVLYRFETDIESGKSKEAIILSIMPASQKFFVDTTGIPGVTYTYLATALDGIYNESEESNRATATYSQLEILTSNAAENILFDLDSMSIDNKTRVKFSVIKNELTNVSLFNHNGEKISNLLNEELKPGTYSVKLNTENLQTGRYFYKLTTPSFSDMKSFVIGKK